VIIKDDQVAFPDALNGSRHIPNVVLYVTWHLVFFEQAIQVQGASAVRLSEFLQSIFAAEKISIGGELIIDHQYSP